MPVARRRAPFRAGALTLLLVIVCGCGTSNPVTPTLVPALTPSVAPSDGNQVPPSATAQLPTPSGPVAVASPTPVPSEAAGVVLAEVSFNPLPGEPPFIEIENAGSTAVGLADTTLVLDGTSFALRPAESALGPGERLLVVLDGPKDSESHVVHVTGAALDRSAGSVELLGAGQLLLDRIAWGSGEANAVSLTAGDFAPGAVEPGTTIGRPPGANQPFAPTEWVAYPSGSASPGAANTVPPVAVLLPADGAIIDEAQPTLEWYPVPGATTYRVEIAADDSFSAVLLDATVAELQIGIGSLAPADYVWRVRAIAADGSTSDQSALSGFELRKGVALIARAAYRRVPSTLSGTLIDTSQQLDVPWLGQRKDTSMLLLEEPHEHAPMAWDSAHQPGRRDDPADQKNCALAMVAMVNHFYGGDLSQDRIGYETFKNRQPGPEEDLNYGYGLTAGEPDPAPPGYVDQTLAAFAFALGAPVTFMPEFASFDEYWATITAEIDAGRPVAGAGSHHGYVITGYAVTNGHRIISVNDPARRPYKLDLEAAAGLSTGGSLWLMPAHPVARMQETSVTTDTDGDGVVDFDETDRFHTDPYNEDTDDDQVRDKQDIISGVFDPTNGYAFHPSNSGRDWDGDQVASELDRDSDGGGCRDGNEDRNGDGHRAGSETWNFDITDDACQRFEVTITHQTIGGPFDPSKITLTAVLDPVIEDGEPNGVFDGYGHGSGTYLHSEMGPGCKNDTYSGIAFLVGSIVGDNLSVDGFPKDPFVLAIYGGEAPKKGGTASTTTPPALKLGDPLTGIVSCEAFSQLIDTVTVVPLDPQP